MLKGVWLRVCVRVCVYSCKEQFEFSHLDFGNTLGKWLHFGWCLLLWTVEALRFHFKITLKPDATFKEWPCCALCIHFYETPFYEWSRRNYWQQEKQHQKHKQATRLHTEQIKETQFSSVIKRFGGGAFQVILLSVLPGNTTLCLYVIISRSFSLRLQVSISLMSEEPH